MTPSKIRLRLVKGNTPGIVMVVRDRVTGDPIDISAGTTTARLRVASQAAPNTVKEVVCNKLTGLELANGTLNNAAPYDVAGKGGRCIAQCDATVFDTAGTWTGELQVTFSATSQQATPFVLLDITVRNPVGV